MSFKTSKFCVALSFAALATTVQVRAHADGIHFRPLNEPNHTAGHAINDLGMVAGNYLTAEGLIFGFVSTPPYSKKSFTTVEVAGALLDSIWGINLGGTVTGFSIDDSLVVHGFVSHPPYGTVTSFDAPGACSSDSNPACQFNGTQGLSINLQGVIAGLYIDANGIHHGFVAHPPYTQSTFMTLDAPGACSSGTACSGSGTVISSFSLNDFGAITGYYVDASTVAHGFVSYPPYTRFTTFDAPGACSSDSNPACASEGTAPDSINFFGVITGTYYDAEGVGHGFVSYPPYTQTTFTSFDIAGSIDTHPSSVNLEGVVTGNYSDASGVVHGFVSHPPYSTVTTFDAPGA